MAVVTTNYMVSGVHTEIEFPDRVSHSRRFGWGLELEQAAQNNDPSFNWFHMGIPYVQSDRRSAGGNTPSLFLSLELNENARLSHIHLREGRRLSMELRPNLVGTRINRDFILPRSGGTAQGPMTIALRIEFLTGAPRGKVTFLGGGLRIVTADEDI